MARERWVGIDPGLDGGIAVVDTDADATEAGGVRELVWLIPMPILETPGGRRVIDEQSLLDTCTHLRDLAPDGAILERQYVHPRTSPATAIKQGYGYGMLQLGCTLAAVPRHEVQASVWKRRIGLRAPDGELTKAQKERERKRAAIRLCKRLMPGAPLVLPGRRVESADLAEAILLALYGASFVGLEGVSLR